MTEHDLKMTEHDLKNCPLCGSDKISMIGEQYFHFGGGFANAEIECFSCGTMFTLKGKSKAEIVELWNGKRLEVWQNEM